VEILHAVTDSVELRPFPVKLTVTQPFMSWNPRVHYRVCTGRCESNPLTISFFEVILVYEPGRRSGFFTSAFVPELRSIFVLVSTCLAHPILKLITGIAFGEEFILRRS
jgi:hypothetical protein